VGGKKRRGRDGVADGVGVARRTAEARAELLQHVTDHAQFGGISSDLGTNVDLRHDFVNVELWGGCRRGIPMLKLSESGELRDTHREVVRVEHGKGNSAVLTDHCCSCGD